MKQIALLISSTEYKESPLTDKAVKGTIQISGLKAAVGFIES